MHLGTNNVNRKTPTDRRQPVGYLKAWLRIWTRDNHEQIQQVASSAGWVRLAGLQVSHADHSAALPGIIRVLMGILGGGVSPSFPILTLSQAKKCQSF